MEQKISSSHRCGDLSASDSESDPERGFSGDDDDDDRNHKHLRRDIRTQSSEYDAPQSVSSKSFNKRNKSFHNGNSEKGNGSRMNAGWNNNSFAPSETEMLKHDRKRFDMPMFSRPQKDMNQRYVSGQAYFGDSGFPHAWGKESWDAHAPGYGSLEFSQAAKHISVTSNLYGGRGISNVAGIHTVAWNPYGLLPRMPCGGLDAVHSLGINPSHRPQVNPPSTRGIIRQKCSDFEERGFCLRGDICPMEHGVNHIVVDDVQSLSKFNLPVSFPGGNGLVVGGITGAVPAGTASASFSVNNTTIHRKMVKSKTARKGVNNDAAGVFSNSNAAENDFYDPDQPLLNKNGPESSTALSQPCSLEIQLEETIVSGDPSSVIPDEVHNGSGIHPVRPSSRSEPKENVSVIANKPGHNDYIQDKGETLNKNQMTSVQGMYILSENKDTNILDASQRRLKGSSRNSQKQQKAMRTVFVNGIPQKDNNIQALRSHFQKFGEIIDIYIPSNGEKAFVQFSTREEAEAALKAPDAVMGNRFIKLWWANRDSIPDTGTNGGNNPYMNPLVGNAYSGPNTLNISSKGRSHQFPASKASATPATSSTPKKKLENLEVLKEELRKKQELLDQKRNEFKRQLENLEKQKQAAGVKCELSSEQPAKRHKAATTPDAAKRITQPAGIGSSINLSEAEVVAEKSKLSVQDRNTVSEPATSLNVINLPLAETNRSKLDTQPRSFKIVPPLPSDLANIVTLRQHFSLYGMVYDVELVNAESDECRTAIISFDSHVSAENAFQKSKSLEGHDLEFTWVSGDIGDHDKILLAVEEHVDVDRASQNNLLRKESVCQSNECLKATAEDITDKVTVPDEKLNPHMREELVECQPSVCGEAVDDFMKQEEQLSEKGYAEKAHDETQRNQDSLQTLDNQNCDEDDERANDKLLSGDESRRSHVDVDHMNEENAIEHFNSDHSSEDDVT